MFDKALAMCDMVVSDEFFVVSRIKFEKSKCREKDPEFYSNKDIIKYVIKLSEEENK